MRVPLPRLLILTDRAACERRGRSVRDTVAAAIAGGASAFILREKDLSLPERRTLGEALMPLISAVQGTLIVASDTALAGELGTPWVHLAGGDNRGSLPRDTAFGRSCHDAESLASAGREGAAYATISPIFPTESKPGYGPALGEVVLWNLAGRPGNPERVYALGGITAVSGGLCVRAGAYGVAVMGGVMAAPDPAYVVADIVAALRDASDPDPSQPSDVAV